MRRREASAGIVGTRYLLSGISRFFIFGDPDDHKPGAGERQEKKIRILVQQMENSKLLTDKSGQKLRIFESAVMNPYLFSRRSPAPGLWSVY